MSRIRNRSRKMNRTRRMNRSRRMNRTRRMNRSRRLNRSRRSSKRMGQSRRMNRMRGGMLNTTEPGKKISSEIFFEGRPGTPEDKKPPRSFNETPICMYYTEGWFQVDNKGIPVSFRNSPSMEDRSRESARSGEYLFLELSSEYPEWGKTREGKYIPLQFLNFVSSMGWEGTE